MNIGPFTADASSDIDTARADLDQMEQVRWVLGNLLEIQDLRALWPVRLILDKDATTSPKFVRATDQYLMLCSPKARIPLGEVARLFLDANTPALPGDSELGLLELFNSMEAHGSRVTWGGPVPNPDLAYARMQLFASKFEYRASFHIFVTSLMHGSSIAAAERNAFAKDPAQIEKEVQENLHNASSWTAVPVSGRPLDPKRDLGEHNVDAAEIEAYIGFAELDTDARAADAAFKRAIEAGGRAKAFGLAGLAAEAKRAGEDPHQYLIDAIAAGNLSASVYFDAAEGLSAQQAEGMLRSAVRLNPKWAEPVYAQAKLEQNPLEKEKLLRHAAELDRRQPQYWLELAQLQMKDGHAIEAQSSWQQAEDETVDPAARDRLHQMREQMEAERLDAAEAERRAKLDAAHEDDTRAQNEEQERIRAAEEKANAANGAASGSASSSGAVDWEQSLPVRKLSGILTRVDCSHRATRIVVAPKSGSPITLLMPSPLPANIACGVQKAAPHVSVTYAEDPDEDLHIAGHVRSFQSP